MSSHLKLFGKTVRSLREDMFDYRNGRGWSREQLAEASGIISPHTIGRIERGQQAQLSSDMLLGLADAFRLTTPSRLRFFLTATAPLNAIAHPNTICEQVFKMSLTQMYTRRPAILHNAFYEIVAVNSAYLGFYNLSKTFFVRPDSSDLQYHHLRLMYDDESPIQKIVGSRIEQGRFRTSAFWRYLALPYRYTQRHADMQSALETRYPAFLNEWLILPEKLQEQDHVEFERSVDYRHPQLGKVRYSLAARTIYTRRGELFLSEHIPSNKRTRRAFRELEAESKVIALANPFPELVPVD